MSQIISAAVVTSSRRLRRQVTMALASVGWNVVSVSFARDALEGILDKSVALFVVDVDHPDPAETRWLLQQISDRQPDASALLLSCEMESSFVGEMVSLEGLNNFVTRQAGMSASAEAIDEAELMVTCQKLVQRDIFGLDKYLTTWGTKIHHHTLASTADKDQAIGQLEEFLRAIDCHGRIVPPISMVAEELMMNAIFNAPRDAETGKAKYAATDRRESLKLEPAETVELSYGCDGRYVGLAVTDRFGALDREVIVNYLKRCFLGERGHVEDKDGGAGLGLYMVFNSITQLSFNIEVGKRTEVIALFYVRDGARAFKNAGRSLHIFLKR